MSTKIHQVASSSQSEEKIIRLSISRIDIIVIIVIDERDLIDLQKGGNAVIHVAKINAYEENQSMAPVAAFQIIHLDGREERVVPADWSIMYEHESDRAVSVEDVLNDGKKRKDRP